MSTQSSEPLPRRFGEKTALLPIFITIVSTVIAVIWALSDTGHIAEQWSKLALIFFTWLAVVLAAWAFFRTAKNKENSHE